MREATIRVWCQRFAMSLFLACANLLQAREVVVIGVNDLHSLVDRVPAFAACLQEERAANPELLLVGAGDIFTETESQDYVNPLYVMSELMAMLQMDVLTLGNHEFDYGDEKLAELLSEGEFQVVCANCQLGGDSKIMPYTILKRGDLRIGIIGIVEIWQNGAPYCRGELSENVQFAPAFKAMESIRFLRSQCDILLVLSHLGYAEDLRLAHLFPEVDAIVGAHSHDVLPDGHLENGVLIVQAGFGLSHYSKIVFSVEDGEVIQKRGVAVPVDHEMKDPRFSQYVESARAHPVRVYLRRVSRKMRKSPFVVWCLIIHLLAFSADRVICRNKGRGA